MNKNPLRPRPRSVAVPNVEAVRAEEVTKLCKKKYFEGRGGDQTFNKNILWLLEYIVTSQARLDISKT